MKHKNMGEWFREKWIHKVAGVILFIAVMVSFYLCVKENWLGFALLGIFSFILSLICMDYMTYNINLKKKKKWQDLEAAQQKGDTKEKEKIKEHFGLIKSLPIPDRIAFFFPEPLEVLDRHEIRRALTISLTVVFFTLLFYSIFHKDSFIKDNPVVELFMWVYLVVIAFYFGSRALEKYGERRKPDSEEVKEKEGKVNNKMGHVYANVKMGDPKREKIIERRMLVDTRVYLRVYSSKNG